MALAERYSCILEDALLETDQSLDKALGMMEYLGYFPSDLGRTSIGPNSDRTLISHSDISMILLKNERKKSNAGLLLKRDVFPERSLGYIVYEIRY